MSGNSELEDHMRTQVKTDPLAALLLLHLVGCLGDPPQVPKQPAQVSEHRFALTSRPKSLEIGEDCGEGGPTSCKEAPQNKVSVSCAIRADDVVPFRMKSCPGDIDFSQLFLGCFSAQGILTLI
jgi:hypothetical protein